MSFGTGEVTGVFVQESVASVQNQWYHFGISAPPNFVYFSGDWDVYWGYDLDFAPCPNEDEALARRTSCALDSGVLAVMR